MTRELPNAVSDYVKKKAEEIEWGSVRVELSMSGFTDVVTEERVRFPTPERVKKSYRDNSPKPGKVVAVRVVKKDD